METNGSRLTSYEYMRNGSTELPHTLDVYACSLVQGGVELTAADVHRWLDTHLFSFEEAEAVVMRYEELRAMEDNPEFAERLATSSDDFYH